MSIYNHLAPTPPLGWNSWDCYGTAVREDEVKANADYMAAQLAYHGWTYIVVDIQWYEPEAKAGGYRQNASLVMDNYGRLLPAPNRFPSAADGAGFRALADYVHSKGLKFGIHILRGIPRQAVRQNLPLFNSPFHAQDIANRESICTWNDDMYGVDVSEPGAQAYYDSLIDLYAAWGVDYIKADDMISPYHQGEVEALSQAIQRANREIVLSLSPGVGLSTEYANHLKQHCELWRISADFWDRWDDLKNQFEICKKWAPYMGPGCWPDADMLPLGHIGIRAERGTDRQSLLTHDEQIALMTLWIMFRSPLMFGGDLPSTDDFTLSLLTNDEVLSIHQASRANRELFRQGEQVVWTADRPDSGDKYLALFNIGEDPSTIEVDPSMLGDEAGYEVRDLWNRADLGAFQGEFRQHVAPHAAKLYRLRRLL
jgi:alpha-galactosidase